jgi:hypothetical protein
VIPNTTKRHRWGGGVKSVEQLCKSNPTHSEIGTAAQAVPIARIDPAKLFKLCQIARRYAWKALKRRTGRNEAVDPTRLIALIRLRELERLFQHRYGRFLPDDDDGRDNIELAAHHIAQLRGEVIEHIVNWARCWAPWISDAEAKQIAERVAAAPTKFTADRLAWRLGLTVADRTPLKITTIGATDCGKAERAEIRKAKDRDRKRAKRAAQRTGKPRGRPIKNASAAEDTSIAADAFFGGRNGGAGRDTREVKTGGKASKERKLSFFRSREATPDRSVARAARQTAEEPALPRTPPAEVIAQAIEIAREHGSNSVYWRHMVGERGARRLLDLFWRKYIEKRRAEIRSYYGGRLDRSLWLADWQSGFKYCLDHEYEARDRYRERRKKWQERRRENEQLRWRTDRRYRDKQHEESMRKLYAEADRRDAIWARVKAIHERASAR